MEGYFNSKKFQKLTMHMICEMENEKRKMKNDM